MTKASNESAIRGHAQLQPSRNTDPILDDLEKMIRRTRRESANYRAYRLFKAVGRPIGPGRKHGAINGAPACVPIDAVK